MLLHFCLSTSWGPEAAAPALAQKESTEPEHEQKEQQQHCQHMQPTSTEILAEQVWPVGTRNFMPRRYHGLGYLGDGAVPLGRNLHHLC